MQLHIQVSTPASDYRQTGLNNFLTFCLVTFWLVQISVQSQIYSLYNLYYFLSSDFLSSLIFGPVTDIQTDRQTEYDA